jgi:D-cysteine desulfhydrase family pyridoxal phosphate-dependent enzyme
VCSSDLSEFLGGPRLFIKRDDMTGLAFGGNKVRKLEFIMADALRKGAKTIITSGAVQTNWGRLAVAAAVRFGMKPVLVLTGAEPESYQGNLRLNYLMDAELHFVDVDLNIEKKARMKALREAGEAKVAELEEIYRAKGLAPYVIPRGGRMTQGTAGYLMATIEILQQLMDCGIKADYIVTGTGSTSTTNSLLLGQRIFDTGIKTIGISVACSTDECQERIHEQIDKDMAFFGWKEKIDRDEIVIFDDSIGPGYGIPSPEGMEAIKLLAAKEAIILDQTYTGKAMAGLLSLIRRGYFKRSDTVIFLHTGGVPALFALEDQYFRGR